MAYMTYTVILLPAHPASFAHNFVSGRDAKFLFQRVPGCNSIADLSLEKVLWTHKFAVGLIGMGYSLAEKQKKIRKSLHFV